MFHKFINLIKCVSLSIIHSNTIFGLIKMMVCFYWTKRRIYSVGDKRMLVLMSLLIKDIGIYYY